MPRKGVPGMPGIKGWHDCGMNKFPGESPPDIHPVTNHAWGVSLKPQDGLSYLGLVVRANNTWESVGQQLSIPLRAGVCYSLTAMLALSETNVSATHASQEKARKTSSRYPETESFSNFVKLVIWGGHLTCEQRVILAESKPVENTDWQRFEFTLKPDDNYSYLVFEAYYTNSATAHYNGHILIDNLSAIIERTCEE